MAAADYRLLTEATGQRIAAALEALSGTGAAAAAARTNLDVYSKGETDDAIEQSTAGGGTWTARLYAGSTQLSATIISGTYKRIGDVIFANIRGTFTSQANGGIYLQIDSGLPAIPSTCALVGTFLVDTAVGTLFHSNGTGNSAYFRLFDGTNQQGTSVSGKGFEVSFFYTAS